MLNATLVILAAYLWGAIPSAYLAARYLKGIDIREYGSGNVGASNLTEQLGKWTGFWSGVFDSVGKGTIPVVVASLMDHSLSVQAVVGLAAIAGHNWSPYIRFTGGRGVSTAIGVMLGFLMWGELLTGAIVTGLIGRVLLRDIAFWTLVTILALPVLAYLFEQPVELIYMSAAIGVLLILKRLTANWEKPPEEYSLRRVLVRRLLWDRDVPGREPWTTRNPPPEERG